MNKLIDNRNDNGDLEDHQLPIEDIVTAVDGQDPTAFLNAMSTMLNNPSIDDDE